MKTKAGTKIVKDVSNDKAAIYKDLETLAKDLKSIKTKKNMSANDEAHMYRILQRAASYKQQLQELQGFVDIAVYLESFLRGK